MCPQEYLQINIHSGPKLEAIQTPSNGRMEKQAVLYPHSGILLSRKEAMVATRDESCRPGVGQETAGTGKCRPPDCISMKFREK